MRRHTAPVPRMSRARAALSACRDLDRRYGELEALTRREHDRLVAGAPLDEIDEIRARKRRILRRIRAGEGRVAAVTRAVGVRRGPGKVDVPALLEWLERVSDRIRRVLVLEADCRALIGRSTRRRPASASLAGRRAGT